MSTNRRVISEQGPIYALMATWLVYLLRNRNIIGLEIADDMIRKVVIMTAINVALCNSFPIDDWYVRMFPSSIGLFPVEIMS